MWREVIIPLVMAVAAIESSQTATSATATQTGTSTQTATVKPEGEPSTTMAATPSHLWRLSVTEALGGLEHPSPAAAGVAEVQVGMVLGEAKVDMARIQVATQGISSVAHQLAREKDILLTPDQQSLVLQAVADTEAVQREIATRSVVAADVDRVRQAESRVVLIYWDGLPKEERKAEILAPYQQSYVFQERFEALQKNFAGIELAQAWQQGAESAAELSRMTDLPRTPGLDDLLESFDRLSSLALQGSLSADLARSLHTISEDLSQQRQLATLYRQRPLPLRSGGLAVRLTVRTYRKVGETKIVEQGYNVRYELKADDHERWRQGTSLGPATTIKDEPLGPFSYVFWAEQNGERISEKKELNLGNPLLESREIELALEQPPLP